MVASSMTESAALGVCALVMIWATAACDRGRAAEPPAPRTGFTSGGSRSSSAAEPRTPSPAPSAEPSRRSLDNVEIFRCRALPTVTFQFPRFERWEPKRTEERPDGCVVMLNWPLEVDYETARLFQVARIAGYDAGAVLTRPPQSTFRLGSTECFEGHANPGGIFTSLAFDASLWTKDHQRPPGQWDYLQFYGRDLAVRLRLDGGGEDQGFSRRAFRQMVQRTFRFVESP